jgi:hypothetical protein
MRPTEDADGGGQDPQEQQYKDAGISQQSIDIIMQSWRGSTKKQYKTYLKKWTVFCLKNKFDPVSPVVGNVLDYLTELFNQGLGYSAINSARSSLSSIINIDNRPVGEHPFVIRHLKGVFNLRPTFPKNVTTWDPDIVLRYLKTLSPTKDLSFKSLTLKCVTLLWLLSGQRGQSIKLIDIRNLTVTKNHVKICYGDLLKTSRPGFQQKEIKLKAYAADKRICISLVLTEYLDRRKALCAQNCTQLFVSITKPHSAVTTTTIAKWVKEVMKNAGLNTQMFTPHSLRAASTSAATRASVPLNTILSTAGWSRESTFRKYYDKPLCNTTYNVLNK